MKFINFSYHIENRVRMSLSYDNRFLEKVGKGSDDLAKKEIRKIINFARCILTWPGLSSKIELVVLEIEYVDAELELCNAYACKDG